MSGFSVSLPRDQRASRVLPLTINQSHLPIVQLTRRLPLLGPFSRLLGRGPNPSPTAKSHLSIPFLPPKSLAGRRRKQVRRGKQKRRRRLRLRKGTPWSSPFRSPGKRDSERLPGLPRSPRAPGPRGARADFRLPLSAAAAAGSASGLGAPLPTPGRRPRASRTLRGCSPSRR